MKNKNNNRSLESFKIFPYLAWTLVAGFSIFVYNIAVELRQVADDLALQSEFLSEQSKKIPTDIKDFTPPKETR